MTWNSLVFNVNHPFNEIFVRISISMTKMFSLLHKYVILFIHCNSGTIEFIMWMFTLQLFQCLPYQIESKKKIQDQFIFHAQNVLCWVETNFINKISSQTISYMYIMHCVYLLPTLFSPFRFHQLPFISNCFSLTDYSSQCLKVLCRLLGKDRH